MTQPAASQPDLTLQLAEQQFALRGELTEMAMAVARAFTVSAMASAKAEETILADEYFTPEVGRAKACGAKAAAESFQKVSRAARLTMMLRMNIAEIMRDIRAGRVTYLGGIAVRKEAGAPADAPRSLSRSAGVLAGQLSDDRASDAKSRDSNAEHLIDRECPDTLLRAPFRDTVEHICGDLGAEVDWTTWRLNPPEPTGETLLPPPADSSVRPPGQSPPTRARPPG